MSATTSDQDMGQTSSITSLESDLDGFSLAAFEILERERDETYDDQLCSVRTLHNLFLATNRIMNENECVEETMSCLLYSCNCFSN